MRNKGIKKNEIKRKKKKKKTKKKNKKTMKIHDLSINPKKKQKEEQMSLQKFN